MTYRPQRPLHGASEERIVSGGVFDHGTYEEDGPGTWEVLAFPRPIPAQRRAGDPSPTHDTLASARVVGPRGTEEAPAVREAVGKGNRSHSRRRQSVGGLHTSVDVGEQGTNWTQPSKGGPYRCDLQEGTMPNALTLETMSPGLLKVVEMRSHEPHRRKSRMVEISLSGSGEKPGWATSRPTLQSPFLPRRPQHPLLADTPPLGVQARRAPGGRTRRGAPAQDVAPPGQATQDGRG